MWGSGPAIMDQAGQPRTIEARPLREPERPPAVRRPFLAAFPKEPSQERSLAFQTTCEASARRPAPSLDDLSSDLCRALRQPLHSAAPSLLLGRGRLLHSRRLGFLPHRLPNSYHHAFKRPPSTAQHLSGVVVEVLRLLS